MQNQKLVQKIYIGWAGERRRKREDSVESDQPLICKKSPKPHGAASSTFQKQQKQHPILVRGGCVGFWHLSWAPSSLKSLLKATFSGRREVQDGGHIDILKDMSLSKFRELGDWQGGLVCCDRFMGSQRVRHDWVTELNWRLIYVLYSRNQHNIVNQLSSIKNNFVSLEKLHVGGLPWQSTG